jgi:hypothetical protein
MHFGDSCLPPPPFIPRATSAKKKGNRLCSFKFPPTLTSAHSIRRLRLIALTLEGHNQHLDSGWEPILLRSRFQPGKTPISVFREGRTTFVSGTPPLGIDLQYEIKCTSVPEEPSAMTHPKKVHEARACSHHQHDSVKSASARRGRTGRNMAQHNTEPESPSSPTDAAIGILGDRRRPSPHLQQAELAFMTRRHRNRTATTTSTSTSKKTMQRRSGSLCDLVTAGGGRRLTSGSSWRMATTRASRGLHIQCSIGHRERPWLPMPIILHPENRATTWPKFLRSVPAPAGPTSKGHVPKDDGGDHHTIAAYSTTSSAATTMPAARGPLKFLSWCVPGRTWSERQGTGPTR